LDTKIVLERCISTAAKTNFNVNTAPKSKVNSTSRSYINTTPKNYVNTAPKSPVKVSPTRGVRRTTLNEYIGRVQPASRERVKFDFDPKDVKSVIQKSSGSKKQCPPATTPKIAQPLVEPVVIDLERLSLHHL